MDLDVEKRMRVTPGWGDTISSRATPQTSFTLRPNKKSDFLGEVGWVTPVTPYTPLHLLEENQLLWMGRNLEGPILIIQKHTRENSQ